MGLRVLGAWSLSAKKRMSPFGASGTKEIALQYRWVLLIPTLKLFTDGLSSKAERRRNANRHVAVVCRYALPRKERYAGRGI